MNKLFKCLLLLVMVAGLGDAAMAQKRKPTAKPPARRSGTKRTSPNKVNANIKSSNASVDSIAAVIAPPAGNDSLPIKKVLKSLRQDEAVSGGDMNRERTPLPYEDLRIDDAVWRHKIWREIDTREKINLPFRYAADENNGNQRLFSILMQAIQDSTVTVFANVDDRFTTPMTKSEVAEIVLGPEIEIPQFNEKGEPIAPIHKRNELNPDSIYKFQLKEEVIFDKESSRLFFRILGIAPIKRIITPQGLDLGDAPLFWVYYPDLRPIFAKYEVYNGKNFGARMSWEELFESRMFYGRIIKSTIDNPYDLFIKNYKGMQDNTVLQLLEGENIKEKIFNYEQDLWSY